MDLPSRENTKTEFLDEDQELRAQLIQLSIEGKITQTKTFLSNRKKCSAYMLRQIFNEYTSREISAKKKRMGDAVVTSLPALLESLGVINFTCQGGASNFSRVLKSNEDAMFLISELIPVSDNSDYYTRLASGGLFLTSLCYHNISLGRKKEECEMSGSTSPTKSRRSNRSVSLSSVSDDECHTEPPSSDSETE